MIYQCGLCFRLLPNKESPCKYCQSTSFIPYLQTEPTANLNYEMSISSIELDYKNYDIIKKIGQGGFGTILLVEDQDKNQFALKVTFMFDYHFSNNTYFSKDTLRESMNQILKEINATKAQATSYQLKVFLSGSTKIVDRKGSKISIQYILMEFALGTLHDLIHDESSGYLYIPPEEKFVIMHDIMDSLDELHSLRRSHGDLHPSNIFMVNRNNEIHYIIADIGLSKSLSTSITHTATNTGGNKYYMDPEKFFNPKSKSYILNDIWSLGVILSEISVGNFWTNYIQKPVKDVSPMEYYKFFLLQNKRFFNSNLFPILKKATTPRMQNRYHHVKHIKKDLSRIHKKFLSSGSFLFFNGLRLYFFMTLSLPFSEYHNDCLNIPYSGECKIELLQYCDYIINMNRIQIKKCRLKETKLFSASIYEGNSIMLKAEKEYWRKKAQPFDQILSNSTGSITFHFKVEIEFNK